MKTFPILIAALACTVTLATGAAETVYKWKDASGRVHFSDQPGASADAEELKMAPSQPAAEDDSEEAGDAEATAEEGGDAPANEQDKAARQAAADKEQKKIREQNCQIARQTQQHNESLGRMYRVDANGERIYLSDEERAMVLKRSREDVEKWCD